MELVVSFTIRLFYTRQKFVLYNVDNGMGRIQSRFGCFDKEESNHDSSVVKPVAWSLYQLSYLTTIRSGRG